MHNYNVIVLGPPGSGKTVYLASMYKLLSIQRGYTSFYLEASSEQRKLLVDKYIQVAAPGEWPSPTQYREVSEWQFNVCVENDSLRKFPVFKFTYLDYAGERIVEAKQGGESEAEFEDKLKQASALLGIIDGQKVLSLMQGDNDAQIFLLRELTNILDIMQSAECPCHFIVSKWDLLDGKYSFKEVRNRLLENDDFRELAKRRSKRREGSSNLPLRLIPVSSVGTGFANMTDDGMRKVPGAQPKPFQVEMPLACVIPDQLSAQLAKIRQKELEIKSKSMKPQADLSLWDAIGELAGSGLRVVRRYLHDEFQFSDKLLTIMINYAEMGAREKQKEAEKRSEEFRIKKEKSLKEVRDEQTAIEHTIQSFMHLISLLERDFPDSDLSSV